MKILYVATVRSHIGQFHMPVIRALKEAGHTVHAAYRDNSADKAGLDTSAIDEVFEVPFERSPYSKQNIKAYPILKKIIDEGNYDIVHCHTPMGAVITRLAARKARKKGTRVIYTAHGFHFFKGSSKKNWAIYYPVEKFLSRYTDLLITINRADYELAKAKKFKAGRIEMIEGVGVDLSKFTVATEQEKREVRDELGIPQDRFVMMYTADLNKNKNQPMLFRALSLIKDKCPNITLLLPGQPKLGEEYKAMCEQLGVSDMVRFLGYRRDIYKLLAACDCITSVSMREGLPVNLIEASARGKYLVVTDVRGNADVLAQCKNGVSVKINDDSALANVIQDLYINGVPECDCSEAVKVYSEDSIVKKIFEFYGLDKL